MKRIAALLTLLILAGCGGPANPVGAPYEIKNVVKDISFVAAHREEHCSKGCSYRDIQDTWFIHFCNIGDSSDCFFRKVTHAPWKWQKEGALVTVTWQRYDSGYNRVTKYVLTDTGEVVDL